MNRPRLNPPGEERSNLANDVEFLRFLEQRRADAQREADRLDAECETHLEQVAAKRREQGEYLTIVEACVAGLGVSNRASRPAPVLSPSARVEELQQDLAPEFAQDQST